MFSIPVPPAIWPPLIEKWTMGSLTCAKLLVCAVHIKVRPALTSLLKCWTRKKWQMVPYLASTRGQTLLSGYSPSLKKKQNSAWGFDVLYCRAMICKEWRLTSTLTLKVCSHWERWSSTTGDTASQHSPLSLVSETVTVPCLERDWVISQHSPLSLMSARWQFFAWKQMEWFPCVVHYPQWMEVDSCLETDGVIFLHSPLSPVNEEQRLYFLVL